MIHKGTLLLILTTLFLVSFSKAATVINFQIIVRDSVLIEYYKPFAGFVNTHINSERMKRATGSFSIKFELTQPTFIRFKIHDLIVDLLCEPFDTITLKINSDLKKRNRESVVFSGANSLGHSFYNFHFNKIRMKKFDYVTDVYETNSNKEIDKLILGIKKELMRQTFWVDSLKAKGAISEGFSMYMSTEIKSILAWHVGELCNKYLRYQGDPMLRLRANEIHRNLFSLVDPLDSKLRTCTAAESYYYTYLEGLYSQNQNIDTSKLILNEYPFFTLAPTDMQWFLWGNALYAETAFTSNIYQYCNTFNKYRSEFGDSPFVQYFESLGICKEIAGNDFTIIEPIDSDLFTLFSFSFPKKKMLIDLWATWCAPCIMEFKNYDIDFNKFMEQNEISLVFISIDEFSKREKWKNSIKGHNLKGYHLIAGERLRQSIKEIVYDGGTIVIPRYLIADENGKIISVDFKRPSDPDFKEEIIKLLR